MIGRDVDTLRWVADRLDTEAREGRAFATQLRRASPAGSTTLQVARVLAASAALSMNAKALRAEADKQTNNHDPNRGEPWG